MIKILLVDDDYLALEGLCQMLHWDDFNGELSGCATDGLDAVSMIEDNPPDVVVADIKMPRMNGIELSRYLYENHRGTRVILLSGHSEFEYAQKALQYRVTDYILKPVTRQKIKELETLLKKIDKELAAKKQIRRLTGSEVLKDRLLSLLRQGDEKRSMTSCMTEFWQRHSSMIPPGLSAPHFLTTLLPIRMKLARTKLRLMS